MDTAHPDFEPLRDIYSAICDAAGSEKKLVSELPRVLRKALDEVIDTPRTGRVWISELEKTEKTYIGTKVEIMVRAFLAFSKGRLDLRIANHDVDVKNTLGRNWMIPSEAVGCACLLLSENDDAGTCCAGLIIAKAGYLTSGKNRDGKRGISAKGLKRAVWFFRDAPMKSFWRGVDHEVIRYVMDSQVGGTERIRRLFEKLTERRVPRAIVESVARQKDPMKRLRKNGGARDPLKADGIVVLNGRYDRELIKRLALPTCSKTEFVSFAASRKKDIRLLQKAGLLDLPDH